MKLCLRMSALFFSGLILMTSCGGGGAVAETPSTGTSETGITEPVATTAEEAFIRDDLPDGLDFKGQTLTTLYREDVADSFWVEAQTGDVVNDAVNAANRAVEERLNVKMKLQTMPGSANADRAGYMTAVVNSVTAADDAFQLVGVLTYNVPSLIQQGVFADLLQVKHLDFEKPWWVSDLTSLATLRGKLYFASGDISLELTQRIFCMLFNKKLMDDLKLESVYDIVNSGRWTMDKLMEISEAASSDKNGNGQLDAGDVYGFVCNDYNHTCGFISSCDLTIASPDKDGTYHIDFGTEHDVNAIQVIQKLLNETKGAFYMSGTDAEKTDPGAVYREAFKSDSMAVITSEFYQTTTYFRDMDSEYGVIPYPKFDENQKDYLSIARNVYSSFCIPVTCGVQDAVGAYMEALASQNYRTTSRTYFETALKVKYARDDQSAQMYDIIKSGLRFNFGYTFNGVEEIIVNRYMELFKTPGKEWTSDYAAHQSSCEAKLAAFYAALDAATKK